MSKRRQDNFPSNDSTEKKPRVEGPTFSCTVCSLLFKSQVQLGQHQLSTGHSSRNDPPVHKEFLSEPAADVKPEMSAAAAADPLELADVKEEYPGAINDIDSTFQNLQKLIENCKKKGTTMTTITKVPKVENRLIRHRSMPMFGKQREIKTILSSTLRQNRSLPMFGNQGEIRTIFPSSLRRNRSLPMLGKQNEINTILTTSLRQNRSLPLLTSSSSSLPLPLKREKDDLIETLRSKLPEITINKVRQNLPHPVQTIKTERKDKFEGIKDANILSITDRCKGLSLNPIVSDKKLLQQHIAPKPKRSHPSVTINPVSKIKCIRNLERHFSKNLNHQIQGVTKKEPGSQTPTKKSSVKNIRKPIVRLCWNSNNNKIPEGKIDAEIKQEDKNMSTGDSI